MEIFRSKHCGMHSEKCFPDSLAFFFFFFFSCLTGNVDYQPVRCELVFPQLRSACQSDEDKCIFSDAAVPSLHLKLFYGGLPQQRQRLRELHLYYS